VTSVVALALRGAGIIAVVAILVVTLAWAFQRRLIYLAGPRPAPPAAEVLPASPTFRRSWFSRLDWLEPLMHQSW
jgi:hypothetical protein